MMCGYLRVHADMHWCGIFNENQLVSMSIVNAVTTSGGLCRFSAVNFSAPDFINIYNEKTSFVCNSKLVI